MKKIAFFAYNLEIGGAEKSLVNVIKLLSNKYLIDLYLYDKKGELLKSIPSNVNIIALKKNKIMYLFFKYIKCYRKWYLNKVCFKDYDLLVAYIEGRLATLITEINIDCPKIAWIHTDVDKHNIGISDKETLNSYQKLNKVIFVSDTSCNSFVNKYNIDKNKTKVIPNILDIEEINKLANTSVIKKNKFTFINVSRMRPEKRHDLLLEAASILKKDNIDFELWLVGDGILFDKVKDKINELNLQDNVKLFGLQLNPYPYIKSADVFVLSSDYEGESLVVKEALILKKPVISTDIKVINEVIDNKYGLIADHASKSLADKMKYIMNKDNFEEISKKVMQLDINYDKLLNELGDIIENTSKK